MKYVIFNDETFAILPETKNHNSVVLDKTSVISAGFCHIESYRNKFDDIRYKVNCWGESITLGIQSRGEEDSVLIMNSMF